MHLRALATHWFRVCLQHQHSCISAPCASCMQVCRIASDPTGARAEMVSRRPSTMIANTSAPRFSRRSVASALHHSNKRAPHRRASASSHADPYDFLYNTNRIQFDSFCVSTLLFLSVLIETYCITALQLLCISSFEINFVDRIIYKEAKELFYDAGPVNK